MDVREPPGAGTLVHHHPLLQCMRINHKLCPSCSWRSRGWQEGCAAAWGWVLHGECPLSAWRWGLDAYFGAWYLSAVLRFTYWEVLPLL